MASKHWQKLEDEMILCGWDIIYRWDIPENFHSNEGEGIEIRDLADAYAVIKTNKDDRGYCNVLLWGEYHGSWGKVSNPGLFIWHLLQNKVEFGYATTEQIMEAAAWVDQEYGEAMKALAESEKKFINQAGCLHCNKTAQRCECDLYARDYLSPYPIAPCCNTVIEGYNGAFRYHCSLCEADLSVIQIGALFRSGVVPF